MYDLFFDSEEKTQALGFEKTANFLVIHRKQKWILAYHLRQFSSFQLANIEAVLGLV